MASKGIILYLLITVLRVCKCQIPNILNLTDMTFPNIFGNTCPKSRPYLFNESCVSKCPSSSPLIVPENDFIYNSPIHCKKRCPTDSYKYRNQCMSKCPDNHVPILDTMECYNGTRCPPSFPVNLPFLCSSSSCCGSRCPMGYFQTIPNRTCIITLFCKKFAYDSKCMNRCPPNYYSTSAESLDQVENPLVVSSFVHYRICINDVGYRTTVAVCFTLAGILLPVIWFFFIQELLCSINCKTLGHQKNKTQSNNVQETEALLQESDMPI